MSAGTEMVRSGLRTNLGPTDWQVGVQKEQGLEGVRTLLIKQQRGRPQVQASSGKKLSRRELIRITKENLGGVMGRKNGRWARRVVAEGKGAAVREWSWDHCRGRQFGVMSDDKAWPRRQTYMGADSADKGELALRRAQRHKGGCCYSGHTLHYHPQDVEGTPLISSCFLSITCKKYDVPRTLSIAFLRPDGSAV